MLRGNRLIAHSARRPPKGGLYKGNAMRVIAGFMPASVL